MLSLAKSQTRLDEEIARLTIKLSSLQTQKNTFAPISRLPTPILAQIFVCYAREDYHHERQYRKYESGFMMFRWMGVSYVCRHWRHVALTCPALWSYLFAASPWWTEALLARSLGSPLRMWVDLLPSNRALDFMARVAMHTERLEECCLRLKLRQSEIERALSMLSSRAPLLRILKISISPLDRRMDWDEHEQATNHHILFNGDTPMLRELELLTYNMPWCWPTLGGLTTLRLLFLAPSAQLTMAELRAILDRSPYLVELDLQNALRGGGSFCQDSGKLHLPSLARLLVFAPFSVILALLSNVEIPSTTRVRLKCHERYHLYADDFIPFCSFLSQRFSAITDKATSSIPIRAICVTKFRDVDLMDFSFSTSVEALDGGWMSRGDWEHDIPLTVNFTSWSTLKRSDDIIGDIFQSVPLGYLKSINLYDCPLSSAVWTDTFWNLPELRSIKLSNSGLSGLIETLSIPSQPPVPNIEGTERRSPCRVFAPSLERLALDDIGFTDVWDEDIYTNKVENLCRVLAQRRQEAGRALEVLKLTDCWYLYERDVEKLSRVVGSVHWDKMVREVGRSTSDTEYDSD